MTLARTDGYAFILAIALVSSPVAASPIDLEALVFTQVLSAGISTPRSPSALDQDFGFPITSSSALSTGGSGRASSDLSTGTLRTEALSEISSADTSKSLVNAFAHVYDVLHFASATTVTYNLAIDGSLSLGTNGVFAKNTSSIFVFNVSDVTRIYSDNPSGFISLTDVLTDETWANVIFDSFVSMDFENTTAGTTVDVDTSIGASLAVDPSDFYLFFLYQTSFTNSEGSELTAADFFSTSVFEFTDLGGTSFESASGLLPGSSGRIGGPAATVSLPSSGLIVLLGLCVLLFERRRKRG